MFHKSVSLVSSRRALSMVSLLALAAGLSACGGTNGGVNAIPAPPIGSEPGPPTPPPPPPPPPPSSRAIEIFEAPATQEFAAVTGGAGDPIRIRYDAQAARYDVMVQAQGWTELVDNPRYDSPAGTPDPYLAFGLSEVEPSFFHVAASHRASDPALVYHYSNLAVWGQGIGAYWDNGQYTAFGMATPAGGVPVSGTGTYQGLIAGSSTIEEVDGLIGSRVNATVGGTVALRFDFTSGSLSGEMHPTLFPYGNPIDLGTLRFVDTIFSVGSRNYSGRFDTSVSGANSFSGLFTGPNAQELIGEWEFPFIYSVDHSTQSASGAWIARRN